MNAENLMQSLQLLGIGLTTVFSVLLLIIFFGNMLIRLINKYAPEEEAQKSKAVSSTPNPVDAKDRKSVV